MFKSLYVCATAAALAMGVSGGNAMSINIGAGMKPGLDATNVIQKAAVYIVEGHPYCFYFDGWHGAGWYRCGFAHRRNLGWGGEYGWQGWNYAPAEKRYGHAGTTVREGTAIRQDTTVRSKSTVREKTESPSKSVGSATTLRRSTTGAAPDGSREIKGGAATAVGGKAQGGSQHGTGAHDSGGKSETGAQGGKGTGEKQ